MRRSPIRVILRSIGISQDGRTVAYAQEKSATVTQLYLYDTYQKKVTKRLDLPKLAGPTSLIGVVSFSPKGNVPAVFTPNGKFIAYGSRYPRVAGGASFISVLNAADGSLMKKLSVTP